MADPWSIIASYPNAGDSFAQGLQSGMERNKQYQISQAMAALSGGSNPDAMRQLYVADPRMGAAMEDQLYQRSERDREAQGRSATADYLLGGNSSNGAGSSYERAVRADPEKFITIAGKRAQVTKDQLVTATKLHDLGMQLLGGVHDQASYDDAKSRARDAYAQFGQNFDALGLPDAYDPAVVRDLQMQGMDSSKQLEAIARENNINSEIDTREAGVAETRRYHDATTSTTQRGQNLSHTDRMRGQDLSSNDRQTGQLYGHLDRMRGQLLSHEDRLRGQNMRGRGGAGGVRDGAIIRNPQTGQRLVRQAGQWVPMK